MPGTAELDGGVDRLALTPMCSQRHELRTQTGLAMPGPNLSI